MFLNQKHFHSEKLTPLHLLPSNISSFYSVKGCPQIINQTDG